MSTTAGAPPSSELVALQRLKARYCRLLDTKDWKEFRSLLTIAAAARFHVAQRGAGASPASS